MPMLATTDGAITLISTPHGRNHFWRFFQMGLDGLHGVWSRHGPTSESPLVSPKFLEIQRSLISERAFAVEYEAEFHDSASRVFRSEDVQACLVSRVVQEETGLISIGIDWARSRDFTAVAVLQGSRDSARLLDLQQFNMAPWPVLADRVAEIIHRYPNAKVTSDFTGVGSFATDDLTKKCPRNRIEEFVFTNKSKQLLIGDLAWMFECRRLAMTPHIDLMRQLEHFEIRTDEGTTKYGGPESVHDDLVIALALAVNPLRAVYRPTIELAGPRPFSSQP